MNLPLYIVTNRKQAVTGLKSLSPVDPSSTFRFFNGDQIHLDIYLLQDAAEPTAEEPFEILNGEYSIKAAIGNTLRGDNRVLLAETSTFNAEVLTEATTDADGTNILVNTKHWKGTLSINHLTSAGNHIGVDDYFDEPDAWSDTKANYFKNDEVCYEGRFYRALVGVDASDPPDQDTTDEGDEASPSVGVPPPLNSQHWTEYTINREQMYLEIVLQDDQSLPFRILHEAVEITQPVIYHRVSTALTTPDWSTDEEVEALTDQLNSRISESDTISKTRSNPRIQRFAPAGGFSYQRVYFKVNSTTGETEYFVATRRIHFRVKAVSTSNEDLTTTLQSIGGVTINSGDYFLLKDQTDQTENGIYYLTSGGWTRVTDYETGMTVVIGEASNAARYWLTTRRDDFGTSGSPYAQEWELAHGTGQLDVDDEAYFEPAGETYFNTTAGDAADWNANTSYSLGQIVVFQNEYYKYIYKSAADASTYDDVGNRNYWARLPGFAGLGQHIYLDVKINPNQNVLRSTRDGLTINLPDEADIPELSDDDPTALTIDATADDGSSEEVSKADHRHEMPGFADETDGGFMSSDDKVALNRVKAMPSALASIGFNGAVHSLAWTGRKIIVGGAFTTYGQVSRNRIAVVGFNGTIDSVFSPGDGFDQTIQHIIVAGDGDIVVANTNNASSYKGGTAAKVWKIDLNGNVDTSFNSPANIENSGVQDFVEGMTALGTGHLVFISRRTVRMTDLTGADVTGGTTTGTRRFFGITSIPGNTTQVFISACAYASAGVAQTYRGLSQPRGLKLIDPNGADGEFLDETFETNAGEGAGATMKRMAVGSPVGGDQYVVVGTPVPATSENGVDHSWNGAGATLYQGLYKIGIDGNAVDGFDIQIVMSTAGDTPVPFFIDGKENIYFGGNVASINGTTVTPNRLYKVDKNGDFIRQYNGFNGQVRAAIAPLNDDFIVVGGDFTEYHGTDVGYFCFIDSAGSLIQFPSSSIASNHGIVQTVQTLPSDDDIADNPSLLLNVFVKVGNPPGIYVWNRTSEEWNDLRQMLNQVVSDVRVNAVTFSPASGTAQATSPFNVTLTCPNYSEATIYYTTDGSTPTRNSSEYSSAISVSTPVTIKAFAVLSGYRDSLVSQARYQTDAIVTLPDVDFDPVDGSTIPTRGTLSVALSVEGHSDATIKWRDDLRDADGTYRTYSSPIVLSTVTTIVAFAEKNGYENSALSEAKFVAVDPLPLPSIEPRYSGSMLIGYKFKCEGADRMFYKIHNRPGEYTPLEHWDHTIETQRQSNGGIEVQGEIATIDLAKPANFSEKGIQVLGSSDIHGLSPIAGLNML